MSWLNDLIKEKYLRTPAIIEAFKKINRSDFLPPGEEDRAELNVPWPIGYGQTISQPLTVAFMLELLAPKPGEKILDVGSGSGWTAALLAQIVGERGRVYGLEIVPELARFGSANAAKYNFLKKGMVEILCVDGYQGLPERAPFDKIIVAAAAPAVPPELLKQLKPGGRMVLPLGQPYQSQEIALIEKIDETKIKKTSYPGFIFVPLIKP